MRLTSAAPAVHAELGLRPLDVLYEVSGLPSFDLPDELVRAYGGAIGFSAPRVYACLEAGLDGVAASRCGSGSCRPGANEHHRFVTGLLRACADAVLIGFERPGGASTTTGGGEDAYPPASPLYARFRRLRGLPPQPMRVVLGGGGDAALVDPELVEGALVLTSDTGARRLRKRLSASSTLVEIGVEPSSEPSIAIEALRSCGYELILCEGGRSPLGVLVGAGLVDELFLTTSPYLVGGSGDDRRVPALGFGPARSPGAGRLLSLRRAGSHVFSRYELPGRRLAGAE